MYRNVRKEDLPSEWCVSATSLPSYHKNQQYEIDNSFFNRPFASILSLVPPPLSLHCESDRRNSCHKHMEHLFDSFNAEEVLNTIGDSHSNEHL